MLRLMLKLIFVVTVVVILHIGLLLLFPSDQNGYLAALLDKQDALENHEPGSILIVGGSSTVFDFDSAILESETGLPVLNTGLHAGLGLRHYLDFVSSFVLPGDVVLLSLEHHVYVLSSDVQKSEALRATLGLDFFNQLPYIETSGQWFSILRYHSEYSLDVMWHRMNNHSDACPGTTYCRASLNQYGDILPEFMTVTDESRQTFASNLIENGALLDTARLNRRSIDLLNDFADEMQEQDVSVYILFPPIPDSIMEDSKTRVDRLAQDLPDALTIDILNEPISYPESLFYDTRFHMNVEGREQFMADILPVIVEAISD